MNWMPWSRAATWSAGFDLRMYIILRWWILRFHSLDYLRSVRELKMSVKIFITLIFFLAINQIIQVKSIPVNNSITSKIVLPKLCWMKMRHLLQMENIHTFRHFMRWLKKMRNDGSLKKICQRPLAQKRPSSTLRPSTFRIK